MNEAPQLNKHLVILSSYAPPKIGGPVFMYNIFSQLPSDSYEIITDSRLLFTGIDPATWLSGKYVFIDRPGTTKKDITQKIFEQKQLSKVHSSPSSRLLKIGKKIPVLAQCIDLFNLVKSVLLFIKTFDRLPRKKPYCLIGVSDLGQSLLATYLIARKNNIPYCFYMFDLYRGNPLPWVERFVAWLSEGLLFTNAQFIIVNNQGTAAYYQRRYGNRVQTKIIYNSTFPEKYEITRSPYQITPPYEIIFTGNISWPQAGSLLNLIRTAGLLADLPLTITLYTNNPPTKIIDEASRHPNVKISYAPYSAMSQIQAKASLLFLPLSWNTGGDDIIATATPGKFTDYLASGRPMLVHAPEYAYVSQYTKQHHLGLVVDQNDVQVLAQAIRHFLNDPSPGQSYVDNALRIFYKNHDARKNAKKLTELINMV